MKGIKTWLSSLAANYFDKGINIIPENNKCLDSGDGYAAK
jgi:hypothetical protein